MITGKANPRALNDAATKRDLEQGGRYLITLTEAHTKGQQDARGDTVNAYDPPKSCELPDWMQELWPDIVHAYNCGWDMVRSGGSLLAKE